MNWIGSWHTNCKRFGSLLPIYVGRRLSDSKHFLVWLPIQIVRRLPNFRFDDSTSEFSKLWKTTSDLNCKRTPNYFSPAHHISLIELYDIFTKLEYVTKALEIRDIICLLWWIPLLLLLFIFWVWKVAYQQMQRLTTFKDTSFLPSNLWLLKVKKGDLPKMMICRSVWQEYFQNICPLLDWKAFHLFWNGG